MGITSAGAEAIGGRASSAGIISGKMSSRREPYPLLTTARMFMIRYRYVWKGTNSYNFPSLTLADPPRFRRTKCCECRRKIIKNTEGWSDMANGTAKCAWCSGLYDQVQGDYYESDEEEDPEVVDADPVEQLEPEPVAL